MNLFSRNILNEETQKELRISDSEKKDLLKLDSNVFNFIIGLKKLSRETGVTVSSMDLGNAAICKFREGATSMIYAKPVGTILPLGIEFRTGVDTSVYEH